MRRSCRWNTDSSGGIHPPFALHTDSPGPVPYLEATDMPRSNVNTLRNLLLVVLCLFLDSEPTQAQGLEYIKAHYTKHEYRIPMRDGVKLFTCVYVPKDESA